VANEYASYGLKIKVKEAGLNERRRSVKLLLKDRDEDGSPRVLVDSSCTNFIESIKSHQRSKPESDAARKDKSCHSVTSFEYFCVNEFPPLTASAVIYGKDPEKRRHSFMDIRPRQNERRSLIWQR
jgi:hypothetical protein